MSRYTSRFPALFALAAYVASLGGAFVFHEHGKPGAHDCRTDACCLADGAIDRRADEDRHEHGRARHAHCCHTHHHGSTAKCISQTANSAGNVRLRSVAGPSTPHRCGAPQPAPCPGDERHHDHNCPICQFLALKQLPAAVATFVVSVSVVDELVLSPVRQPQIAFPALPLSRAPPVTV